MSSIKTSSQMSSIKMTSAYTAEVIEFIDEYNPKYMMVYFIQKYIIKTGYYIILYICKIVCMFRAGMYGLLAGINAILDGILDIPYKVNCAGFTLSTTVKHVRPLMETIAKAPKFLSWLKGIKSSNVRVEKIEIMDADFFCSTADPNTVDPKLLGFLKIKCEAFDQDNKPVDGIVLIRGPCAVVCPVIEDESGNEFIMTVEQFRMPMRKRVEEFLAGMCDEHEVENPRTGKTTYRNTPMLNAVLVKELKEEAGLVLDASDPKLFYLGDIMLSPGLLDEKAKIFAWYTKLSNDKIEEMLAKEHGESGTNERIRLHLYPIEEFHRELHRIGDAKTEVAFIRMLNKDEADQDDDLSDEDYVEGESEEDDDESDESEDDEESEESEDDDESDDESEKSEEDDDDYMPELIDSVDIVKQEDQAVNQEDGCESDHEDGCESDHEDMREEYIKEQKQEREQEEYMQKQQEEQQLYVFVPDNDTDGQEFDELLQYRKSSKPNSPNHNVEDLRLD